MTIQEKIKTRRIELGMSQADLADKIGKSRGFISKIERHLIAPVSYEIIVNIANALDTTPEYLMNWHKPDEPPTVEDWDAEYNSDGKLADEVKLIEGVEKQWGKSAVELMSMFNSLNAVGQQKVIDFVTDLTMIDLYK